MPVIAQSRPNRGFTAVEISMVVTVIAILALLILPLFQRQTDEARITAAQGDIREMAIAMQLANANTGYYFTLSALDNTDFYDDTVQVDPSEHVPIVTWNDALEPAQHAAMADTWKGPYASFQRTAFANELPNYWFRPSDTNVGDVTSLGINDGPINQQYDSTINIDPELFGNDRIPLDPWGNPYLFYGPDYYHIPGGISGETRFRNTLFLSLGPNGVPGDQPTFNAGDLRRERGIIAAPGTDDIFRIM